MSDATTPDQPAQPQQPRGVQPPPQQPYGAPGQPYNSQQPHDGPPPQQPYGAPGQAYNTQQPRGVQPPPQQPYGAPGQPYNTQQPYGGPPAAAPLSPQSDQQAAMWAHIGGIIGFLPSLIIWLVLKDRGPVTRVEGKEALNWQITLTIVWIVLDIAVSVVNAVLAAAGLWWLMWLPGLALLALWVLNIVWSIQGGLKVNHGGGFRYPFNFRFIK